MREIVEEFRKKNKNIEVSSKNLSAILKNLEKIKKKTSQSIEKSWCFLCAQICYLKLSLLPLLHLI